MHYDPTRDGARGTRIWTASAVLTFVDDSIEAYLRATVPLSATDIDVSFDVPDGGYGVVIGPAGSGKTTLLETVAGVIRPTSAKVKRIN